MAYERKCTVCGTVYKYCPTCSDFAYLEPWHTLYHDENCKKIFKVCSRYASGGLAGEKAKAELKSLNIPKTLVKGIEKNINEIMSIPEPQPVEPEIEINGEVETEVEETEPKIRRRKK